MMSIRVADGLFAGKPWSHIEACTPVGAGLAREGVSIPNAGLTGANP